MTVDPSTTLRLTEVVAAVSVLVGTLELLATRSDWGDRGTWRWDTLRTELRGGGALLATIPFTVVLVVRAAAALSLLVAPWVAAVTALWGTSLLANLRFRGTYNGGSDHMLMVVLTALLVGRLGAGAPVAELAAVAWIGVQGILSYTVAGIAKVRSVAWRQGTALPALFAIPAYGVPASARRLMADPRRARAAAWGVLAFECAFPLVLLGPRFALVGIGIAALFHLGNAWTFGLNRFLLTWAATWPAIVHVAHLAAARA